MTNTINEKMKSLATPNLNAVILRGITDKLKRINAERLNEEGHEALREAREAMEDLVAEVIALRLIEEWEAMEG
jgi:hypothetical protein